MPHAAYECRSQSQFLFAPRVPCLPQYTPKPIGAIGHHEAISGSKALRKRGCWWRCGQVAGVVLVLLVAGVYAYLVYPLFGWPFRQNAGPVPLTPPWALECWLWEDDHNDAAMLTELVEGFEKHDIPVRTLLVDAPWSTRLNDFNIDPVRYPDPEAYFGDLKERGYRLVFWMTTMVNSENRGPAIVDSSDWFQEAADNGYLIGGDYQARWWRGRGGFIDYTNPEAMAWWRGMQQAVLDLGADGWKLDDSATLLSSRPFGLYAFFNWGHDGLMTTRRYMDHFYRDEYQHGLTQNPEFITFGRSLDVVMPWAHYWGFAPLDASALNWIGDARHTWSWEERGLERTLWAVLRSARLGYNLPGSDIGGYHGGMEIPANLYIRWAQHGCFSGFFLNGGHGERRLWKRSPEELEIIRLYSWLRQELVPYIYSQTVIAHEGGPVLLRPTGQGYQYGFGEWFHIAPIHEDVTTWTVNLPAGRWRYFWDDAEVIEGPARITRDFPLDEYPIFIRDGAIIPMNIERAYTGIGDEDWAGFVTYNLYPHGETTYTVHHTCQQRSTAVTMRHGAGETTIALEGDGTPHILRVFAHRAPIAVRFNGEALPDAAWHYDAASNRILVRSEAPTTGEYAVRWQ